ncbi:sensor histidine kinase [Arundinibacter roseus]|uniref:Sensor protein lytS n=1 Tax=Arundinibacter roseus TaxID=2070510 RepID=A0A4R4KDI2_9BACT|nr:histidine kinase [Arundinibacter roseus]TDB65977.1 sensor protein lytS [Arundinibacter roseus]
MYTTTTLRRLELFLIPGAVAVYVIRRLFETAGDFDFDILRARSQGVKVSVILNDLLTFDYNLDIILPTISGAVLLLGAWYTFHFQAFPRIKEKNIDNQTYTLLIVAILLAFGSVFVYSFFKLEWRLRYSSPGRISGFVVFSLFRKLHLLTSTVGLLLMILLYEAFMQVVYHTHELYQKYQQPKHLILQNILLTVAAITLLFWMSVGRVANLILGGTSVSINLLIIVLTLVLHHLFFAKIIPYFVSLRLNTRDGIIYLFAGICGYGLVSFLVFILALHRGDDAELFAVLYVLPTIVALLTAILRWVFFVEKQQLKTKVLVKTAELSTLRSQINPHFLFNALNTLYAVAMKENSEQTADGIQKLGDMMRFMLHENNQERIALSQEINYLHNFLDLQRMRLNEAHPIEIRVNIQEPQNEIYLAPMLLNPFVENAFKHGISLRNPSWVYITLTHDATKLYFKVHNSVHPKVAHDPEKEQSGIGLDNVKKRLDLLYPNRHVLDIQATEHDFFVSLVLGIY